MTVAELVAELSRTGPGSVIYVGTGDVIALAATVDNDMFEKDEPAVVIESGDCP